MKPATSFPFIDSNLFVKVEEESVHDNLEDDRVRKSNRKRRRLTDDIFEYSLLDGHNKVIIDILQSMLHCYVYYDTSVHVCIPLIVF